MTTDLLDADIPTETFTVHDDAGFEALPLGTHLEDQDGDRYEKMREGYREYGDAEPRYTHLYLTAPAVVLNPEVLGSFPLQAGDRAVINGKGDTVGFTGLAVQVLKRGNYDQVYVQPLTDRPDGYGLCSFWWHPSGLTAFTPEPLKMGDRVRRISDTHFIRTGDTFDYANRECDKGEVGTVEGFSRVSGGDGVFVNWDKRNYSYIAATQLAAYVDPKPEPVRENFDMTGAYVKGQEALDALPNMTIVDPLSSYLPMLKLRTGEWVSIGNVSKHGPTVSASWVKDSVAEHGGVVVYASPEDD